MFNGIEEIKILGAYIFVFGLHCPLLIRVLPILGILTVIDLIHAVPCISVGPKNC